MKRHTVTIVSSLLLVAVAGGAWWWFNKGPGAGTSLAAVGRDAPTAPGSAAPKPPAAVLVEAVKVRTGTSRQTVAAVGTFRSNEAVMVRPELASRVIAFNFTEGQKVAKGQVLVKLDASLDEALLAQAEAALVLSKANYDRAMSLLARQAGTEKAVDEARAALRRDEALVALGRSRVEKYTLVAPFDGVIGLRRVSIGSYLQTGADIVNLEQIDPLKVDFRVPEIFLAAIQVGQTVTLTVDAFAGREFPGQVYAIDPLVDEAGRSIVIRAQVDNRSGTLRPGVFARVALTLATRENALFVPEHAIVPVGDRLQVYRIVDGKSVPTFVKAGQREKGQVEILEGVSVDDMVITAGHLKLSRPGMPVTVVPPGGGRSGSTPAAGSASFRTSASNEPVPPAGDGPPPPLSAPPTSAKTPSGSQDRGG
ncbi:efflux RND transporter periplasmic adaptor subunit [Vineibacter terrae]|uniref:Efflux RND transporter periplasmic adaptor subunit n=1 Tax=Vineibacter terrae TaxID=2586908 RepID=A0A5C8P8W0_9HYPH|nr:efflux RND transporter periplasmic adaptor subunit [Vineibacter terrae]TXL69467.1 efflux RND transporter periplasmic adaptor subunit [Vineibacter terrae]